MRSAAVPAALIPHVSRRMSGMSDTQMLPLNQRAELRSGKKKRIMALGDETWPWWSLWGIPLAVFFLHTSDAFEAKLAHVGHSISSTVINYNNRSELYFPKSSANYEPDIMGLESRAFKR